MASSTSVFSAPTPSATICAANAASTAAAGADGVEMRRLVPPASAATSPIAVVPRMPASAPSAACSGPSGEKMVTPKAMADGSATSIAASPPHASPARPACACAFIVPKRGIDYRGSASIARPMGRGYTCRRPTN